MDDKSNGPYGARPPGGTMALLWAVVAIELISPIPAILTFGAAWVLLARPPWFLTLIRDLYGLPAEGERSG